LPFYGIATYTIPLLVAKNERPSIPKDLPPKIEKLVILEKICILKIFKIKACWHMKQTKRPSATTIVAHLDALLRNFSGKQKSISDLSSSGNA
jgi:hypothetical protein